MKLGIIKMGMIFLYSSAPLANQNVQTGDEKNVLEPSENETVANEKEDQSEGVKGQEHQHQENLENSQIPQTEMGKIDADQVNDPVNHQLLAKIKEKINKEPSVEKVISAALVHAEADMKTALEWKKRVRLAPLLPTVKLTTAVDMERDESLDRAQDEPDKWGADTDRDFGFQLTAQWQLGELVFNTDELKVYNATADRAQRREAIISLVVGYYFERQKLLLLQALEKRGVQEKIIQKIRIQELTTLIDSLTGGILSHNIYMF